MRHREETPGIDRVLLEEIRGQWTMKFTAKLPESGFAVVYAVDVSIDGVLRGRSSVSRAGLADDRAVPLLREVALNWIADYETRHGAAYPGLPKRGE
jgi:hypothetical protein